MKVIKIQPSEQKKSNLNKSESNKKQFKYNQVKIEPKTYALISLKKKKKKDKQLCMQKYKLEGNKPC